MSRWPVSLFTDAAEKLDHRFGWDKMPRPIAMLTLIGIREPPARGEPLRQRPGP